jgi:hypothetical protein
VTQCPQSGEADNKLGSVVVLAAIKENIAGGGGRSRAREEWDCVDDSLIYLAAT